MALSKDHRNRLLNVMIRAVTMACRFILLIALARLLKPEEVGLFGLFAASVLVCQLVVGGEFYTYSQRELISAGRSRWLPVLQNQLLALSILYVVFTPIVLAVFFNGLLPLVFLGWFLLILIFESIAQELNRILIAMQRQLIASMVLFIRHGLWVVCVISLIWVKPELRALDVIFFAWFTGCFIAIGLGFFVIWRQLINWELHKLDLAWIIKGYKVSIFFMVGALCLRAIFTVDRYVVERLVGLDFLGAYVVYIGVAMTIVTILDPLIFSFLYPRLVVLAKEKDHIEFSTTMRELTHSTLIVAGIAVIFVAILAPVVFSWIDKPIYQNNVPILWVLLLAAMLHALSMVPHFGLYALKADKALLSAHVIGLVVFLVSIFSLPYFIPLPQVAGVSLVFCFLIIGVLKAQLYRTKRLELEI